MKTHLANTRRQLGELAAMAHQNDAVERKILARAQSLLSDIAGKIDKARAAAMAGDDAAQTAYTDMVQERGRLHRVIAQARSVLP